ncbi:hypothetical protein [Paenibacillus sp. 481]|uniref:hypothetical protein n=1 Tax=Paenibacillus sp. 481 TaxID=2835869 RepID=UPI001E5E290E|nr:hypothetical protein [Paenibacillus sp. 481]UHA74442.1 hypothetical protein KIK04_04865 [Paenibacillus sp. 481]
MCIYGAIFNAYKVELNADVAEQTATAFYAQQVRSILTWIDLSDSEQLDEIRRLNQAFATQFLLSRQCCKI